MRSKLSHRERQQQIQLFKEGQEVVGCVRYISPDRLFLELVECVDGVLEVARTPYPDIAFALRVGDAVPVTVRSIALENEMIRLELIPDLSRYSEYWPRLQIESQNVPSLHEGTTLDAP